MVLEDKTMECGSTCEPCYVVLGDKKIADIVVTNHARMRWRDRISKGQEDIAGFMWRKLRDNSVESYYRNEQDVYLIDEDIVVVCEFSKIPNETDEAGNELHKMIVVTFLGRLSETIELRDLKTYYSWLRHSRRMTLIKSGRKRR